MSPHPATADRWVGDLEDILGLQPVRRPEPGAGGKAPKTRSVLSPTSLGIVVACVALVAVGIEVDRRGLPTDLVRRFAGPATTLAPPSSSARTTAVSILPVRDGEPDEGQGLAGTDVASQRTPDQHAARPADASGRNRVGNPSRASAADAVASATARTGRERGPLPSRGTRATMSPDAGDRPSAPSRFANDASGTDRTPAGAGVATAARPKGALPADAFETPAFTASPPPALPPLAGTPQEAPAPARSDANGRNSARKTEAIDALRTLRRQ